MPVPKCLLDKLETWLKRKVVLCDRRHRTGSGVAVNLFAAFNIQRRIRALKHSTQCWEVVLEISETAV